MSYQVEVRKTTTRLVSFEVFLGVIFTPFFPFLIFNAASIEGGFGEPLVASVLFLLEFC